MTDWRKLLVDEQLWDYRCKAVPVPLVREIVEEVETLRQDLAAARADAGAIRELMNCYNVGGWTDAKGPIHRALVAEKELAATRALLGEARGIVHAYLRGWPNSDAGELMDRIDAALGRK